MFAVKALIAAPTSFDLKKFERDLTELEEKVGVEVLTPASPSGTREYLHTLAGGVRPRCDGCRVDPVWSERRRLQVTLESSERML
jgi:hypothetical protein